MQKRLHFAMNELLCISAMPIMRILHPFMRDGKLSKVIDGLKKHEIYSFDACFAIRITCNEADTETFAILPELKMFIAYEIKKRRGGIEMRSTVRS